MSALQDIEIGNSIPLPLPLRGWLEAVNSESRNRMALRPTPGSRNTNPGTHTTPKAAVGLGAQRFPGERPAGNSPLICGGSHSFLECVGLRAGCVSLHRCKWRQGQSRHSAPNHRGRKR